MKWTGVLPKEAWAGVWSGSYSPQGWANGSVMVTRGPSVGGVTGQRVGGLVFFLWRTHTQAVGQDYLFESNRAQDASPKRRLRPGFTARSRPWRQRRKAGATVAVEVDWSVSLRPTIKADSVG